MLCLLQGQEDCSPDLSPSWGISWVPALRLFKKIMVKHIKFTILTILKYRGQWQLSTFTPSATVTPSPLQPLAPTPYLLSPWTWFFQAPHPCSHVVFLLLGQACFPCCSVPVADSVCQHLPPSQGWTRLHCPSAPGLREPRPLAACAAARTQLTPHSPCDPGLRPRGLPSVLFRKGSRSEYP